MQIIHLSEVAAKDEAKDEFLNIKNVTHDDVLAAHRVPSQLLGVIPQMAEVNSWVGCDLVTFTQYQGVGAGSVK